MEKINQGSFLLSIAEQNNEIIYKNNKTLAKLSWLRPWEKNPKLSEDKDIKRLETQITELGVYKPLVIYLEKNNAVILGGNQRYKVFKKNEAKFEYVWVSIVNADNDYDKMKYALSDNEQIGKYDRAKLKEILEVQLQQGNLFNNYSVDFENGQTLDKMIDDLNMTEQELKFKYIKKNLQEMGINDETIQILQTMTTFNKHAEELADVDITGKIVGQKFPFLFWITDQELWEQLKQIFNTNHKDKQDDKKLIYLVEKHFDVKLPTDKDKLLKMLEEIKDLNRKITECIDLNATQNTIQKLTSNKEKLDLEIQSLYQIIYGIN